MSSLSAHSTRCRALHHLRRTANGTSASRRAPVRPTATSIKPSSSSSYTNAVQLTTADPADMSQAKLGFERELNTLPTVTDAVREGACTDTAKRNFHASVGFAQARYFENLCASSKAIHIVSSEKFDLPQTGCCGGVSQSVRFQLGGSRLDQNKDVNRVTGTVVERLGDERVRIASTATGSVFGEICFPLDGEVDPKAGPTSVDSMVATMQALFMSIEEPAVLESVQCLMEKGSDDRSVFEGEERVNKYHTGMIPKPVTTIHRGSCTSSSPTPEAQKAAINMAQRMWATPGYADDTALMGEVCERVTDIFARGVEGAAMVAHPSGTDAENIPLMHAILTSRRIARETRDQRTVVQRGDDRPASQQITEGDMGSVTNIVVAAGEVGSGTARACEGRFFSSRIPIGGSTVENSSELPDLSKLARMEVHEMVCRCEAIGMLRDDYDAMVEEAARSALHSDPAKVVVLHMVAGSKTGMTVPSEACVARLTAEFGTDRLVCVLDCCQMRHKASLIPRWLDEHGFALVTASKFYAGPSFAGGVLMSGGRIADMNGMLESEPTSVQAAFANASASYLTPHDVGQVIPRLTAMLPAGPCNYGLLLRWASGLFEMERVDAAIEAAGGHDAAGEAMRTWVTAVRGMVDAAHADELERLPVEDYDAEGADYQMGGINSIVALRLRSDAASPFLNANELKEVYGFMYADSSGVLPPGTLTAEEEAVMARRVLLGQPVAMPDGSAVLRTCMGAPQFAALLSGAEPLAEMLEVDAVVLAKLALCARHFKGLQAASA